MVTSIATHLDILHDIKGCANDCWLLAVEQRSGHWVTHLVQCRGHTKLPINLHAIPIKAAATEICRLVEGVKQQS